MDTSTPEKKTPGPSASEGPSHFIKDIVAADTAAGKWGGRVMTRFPPEPNGYLHIGHAKSITLNFGLAAEYGGVCNLRFDDTNPTKEDIEYVNSIQEDVRWLGFDWGDRLYYASDYFEKLYVWAEQLIRDGKAYVCSLSPEEMREYRGNYFIKGRESPYRNRTVAENLDLFRRMRAGEFPDSAHTLRAKIDMNTQNMNLRDPPMYRIRHAEHHRTGDKWCIYPTYDWAHGQSDAIEGVTHSICTLEFESHRPLYEWFLQALQIKDGPEQTEFARLKLSYTVMSKRKLLELVQGGSVSGWDDPRMPTIAGLRRRGYSPESIRAFAERIGVARADSLVDVGLLEHAVRAHLNETAPRVMAVLRPLKLVIDNYPEGQVEEFDAPYFPEEAHKGSPFPTENPRPSGAREGSRKVPFSKVLYVERDDFREEAHKKWFRLAPGREVRLRWACLVTCTRVVKNDQGEVVELHGEMDLNSRGGNAPDGRRVNGTLHWVSAAHALPAEVRLYDRLFTKENPAEVEEGADWKSFINPGSLERLQGCLLEPSLKDAAAGGRFQFERLGYFCVDPDSRPGAPVWNRTVSLKDSWAKIEQK